MGMDLRAAMKGRLEEETMKRNRLIERWSSMITAVDKYLQEDQNRSLTFYDKQNIAQCLENALLENGLKAGNRMFEATNMDNVEFMAIQLPVIAALLPSLCLNKVSTVQALDRRQGAVFFLDLQYGTAKGNIAVGDTMISATTGHNATAANLRYAVTTADSESLSGAALTSSVLAGTLTYQPMLGTVSIVVTDGSTYTDNVNPGQIEDSSGNVLGWVKVSGAYEIDFTGESVIPDSGGEVAATYCYQYDQAGGDDTPTVNEVNIDLRSEMITAQDFPLKAIYSMGASIDLQKAHGLVLEDELVKFLGGEIDFGLASLAIAA